MTADAADTGGTRPGAGDGPRGLNDPRAPLIASVLLIALALAVWAYLAWPGFFRVDDYYYVFEMQKVGPWSGDWLDSVFFNHWAPLYRMTFSVMGTLSVADWHGVVLFELALFGLGLAAFYGTLELLFGRSWWLVAGIAVAAFTVQFWLAFSWPSSGLFTIPDFAASTVCVFGWVRYRQTGRKRWLAVSLAALTLGLLFYVRVLMALLVILFIRFGFLEERVSLRVIGRALWSERRSWALYAVIAIVYVIQYLARDAIAGTLPYTGQEIQDYARILWFRNVWPRIFGAFIESGGLTTGELIVQVGAQVLLIASLGFTLWRKRSAWRGWALIGACLLATVAITTRGRLGELGPVVGYDIRYSSHLPWIIVLGVLYAFHPRTKLELGSPWPVRKPGSANRLDAALGRFRPALAVAVVVIVAVGVVKNVRHADRLAETWGGKGARSYAVNVSDTLQEVQKTRGTARLRDQAAAVELVGPGFVMLRSLTLDSLGAPASVTKGEPTAFVGDDGRALPLERRVAYRLPLTRPRGGEVTLANATWRRAGGASCMTAGATAGELTIRPRPPVVSPYLTYVRARLAGPPGPGTALWPDAGSGFVGYPNAQALALDGPTPEQVVVNTGVGTVNAIRIRIGPNTKLCLRSLALVTLKGEGT